MKILIITSAKSGPLKTAHSIANYLAEKGDQVYVYLLDFPEYNLTFKNIKLDTPSRIINPLGYLRRLIRLIALKKVNFQANVILTSFAITIPLIKIFFPRVPVVYRMMGFPRLQFSQGLLKFAYAMEILAAKRYAKKIPTITTSKYYHQLVLDQWGINIQCIHNGVDINFYKPPEDKDRLKRDLGLTRYDYVVTLGLTRFNEVFKPLTYIQWYLDALSNHKEKKILTLILGKTNDAQKKKIQEMFEKHLIRQKVNNHSFIVNYIHDIFNLRNYYQVSDVFISFLPQSLMEKEALACGVPVVTAFWEGENASKQLINLQHKFVRKNFIKIINTLLDNEKERAVFSKKARFIAEIDFSSEAMGEKYRRIFQQISNH
jgi:glycosyltransferase involved in cell wall biosynthesis